METASLFSFLTDTKDCIETRTCWLTEKQLTNMKKETGDRGEKNVSSAESMFRGTVKKKLRKCKWPGHTSCLSSLRIYWRENVMWGMWKDQIKGNEPPGYPHSRGSRASTRPSESSRLRGYLPPSHLL